MRKLIIFITILTVSQGLFAQKTSFMGRVNGGVGFTFHTLEYYGSQIAASPGGGIGLELGLATELVKNLNLHTTIGLQYSLALQYENYNGSETKSSFSFNKKFLAVGLDKVFAFGDGVINGFTLDAGLHLNLPGKLKRTEENRYLGAISYDFNLGYYLGVGIQFNILESVYIYPTLRYRSQSFNASTYSEGDVESLPTKLTQLDANGIELGLTLVKKLPFSKEK